MQRDGARAREQIMKEREKVLVRGSNVFLIGLIDEMMRGWSGNEEGVERRD